MARCYPPDPTVLTSARVFAAQRLRALELTELTDDVELLLTELITNVIIHARTDFRVRIEPSGDGVRVEVLDGNQTKPVPGTLAPAALSCRGLALVQSLSTRWGVEPNGDAGKTPGRRHRTAQGAPRSGLTERNISGARTAGRRGTR